MADLNEGGLTLIKSAGYMWHRKYVRWEGRPRWLGGVSEDRKSVEVNFADQSSIYGLYDANHQCIYIGQAGRGDSALYERLKAHALEDHLFCFWERFTWFGFYSAEELQKRQYNNDTIAESVRLTEALNTIESVSIYLALPRFNRRYGSGFDKVSWYYQIAEYQELKNSQQSLSVKS